MVATKASLDRVAERAARDWLALCDAGRTDDCWRAASTLFRHAVTPAAWAMEYGAVRAELGTVRARIFHGAHAFRRMVGVPTGAYWLFRFDTLFAGTAEPVPERITVTHEPDGAWRVVGYNVPAPWAPRKARARSPRA